MIHYAALCIFFALSSAYCMEDFQTSVSTDTSDNTNYMNWSTEQANILPAVAVELLKIKDGLLEEKKVKIKALAKYNQEQTALIKQLREQNEQLMALVEQQNSLLQANPQQKTKANTVIKPPRKKLVIKTRSFSLTE